jgi:hypothetical protein
MRARAGAHARGWSFLVVARAGPGDVGVVGRRLGRELNPVEKQK